MTVREVAEMLNIPEPTVYYLKNAGKIPVIEIGGRVKFHRGEIEKLSRVIRVQTPEKLHNILGDALQEPVTDKKAEDDFLTASMREELEKETAQGVISDTLYDDEVGDLQEAENDIITRITGQRFGSGIFTLPKENGYFPKGEQADVFVTDYNGPHLDAIPGLQEGFA